MTCPKHRCCWFDCIVFSANRLVAILIALIALSGCAAEEVADWKLHQQGVIRLEVDEKNGTGLGTAFSIDNLGHYITNWHVVSGAWPDRDITAVESTAPSLKLHPAEIVWHDKTRDLALVKVNGWKRTPYNIVSSSEVDIGVSVYSSGFPGSNDSMTGQRRHPADTVPTLKQGIISEALEVKLDIDGGDIGVFEHDASVNEGNSGGPLFDACGRIVGVNVAKAPTNFNVEQAVNDAVELGQTTARLSLSEGAFYAIASDELVTGLNEAGVEFTTATSSCGGGRGAPLIRWQSLLLLATAVIVGAGITLLLIKRHSSKVRDGSSVNSAGALSNNSKASVEEQRAAVSGNDKVEPASSTSMAEDAHQVVLISTSAQCPAIKISAQRPIVVGRDPNQCDYVISQSDKVSRCHARLSLHNGAVVVLDLESTWGTFIETQPVATAGPGVILLEDQRLMFGSENITYKIGKEWVAE